MVLTNVYRIAIVVLAMGTLSGAVAWFLKESPREMPPVLKELSDDVAGRFATAIPRTRDVNDLLILILQRGNRDEEAQFRKVLKQKVRDAGKYKIEDWEDLKKKFNDNLLQNMMAKINLLPGEDPKDLAQAKSALRILAKTGKEIDGVLLVDVTEFNEGDEGFGAKVTCEGEIFSVAKDATIDKVPTVSRSIDSHLDYVYLHHRLASATFVGRFLLWFLVAATQPFVLIQLVRGVVKRRKNELNLMLLAGFTVVDLALAWVLISAIAVGLGTGLLLLLLTGLLGYYNYDAIDYIERRLT